MSELTAVAMSGGVDSSVAAALVADSGRSVVGFSMKLVDSLMGDKPTFGQCCSPEDFQDARRVAEKMGFPHYILDMEDDFKRHVLQPFADDYVDGRTPSPCVRCNTFLKFGALVGRARAVGAQKVVTGHYARLERDPKSGRTLMRRAVDLEKDQSYFLFDLSEAQRSLAEFPLGALTKDEVREAARRFELDNAEKPESMDLCFVAGGETYRSFMERNKLIPTPKAGAIVDKAGEKLGDHQGIEGYTVGQRRGIGVTADHPLYVLKLEPQKRTVVVGEEHQLWEDTCVLERTRWLPFERLAAGERVTAQVRIRSTHEGAKATIKGLADGRAELKFEEAQKAIAPGQAAVAYDGDYVLGGGWIAP